MQAFRRLALLARNGRNFSTTAVRRGGAAGEPGNNLPFDIHNHRKLAVYFILYFGSGLAVPFIVVRKQLLSM